MSTTFEVYPRTRNLPSFGEVIDRSTQELHGFLESVGIDSRPVLHARLRRKADDVHLPLAELDPFCWNAETYAWFMVDDVPGGTDVYFERGTPNTTESWQDEFERPKAKQLEPLIRECIGVGHHWWFRRSAGQPAIICLAYGLLAGSLADITNGFIYSGDSAWDYERLPAEPEEFLRIYFRPALALGEAFKSWSERCLSGLRAELQGHRGDD